jgi:hypothetical protein
MTTAQTACGVTRRKSITKTSLGPTMLEKKFEAFQLVFDYESGVNILAIYVSKKVQSSK